MTISDNSKKVVITIGPPDKPYAKIFLPDKRVGEEDRRKAHTFVAQDRRSGIADRRIVKS
jgi:hypothetical protein